MRGRKKNKGERAMKFKLFAVAILLAVSPGLMAVNCDKNPTHASCGPTGPTLEERVETLEVRAFDFDFDGDAFSPKGGDCNDADASINPNALEVEGNDIDENCDDSLLIVDFDGDGYFPPQDCDDDNSGINPGEAEVCGDGIDNNCTAGIDEGCQTCSLTLVSVTPSGICSLTDNVISVSGSNFTQQSQVILHEIATGGGPTLATAFVSGSQLQATVTASMPSGAYDVIVDNQDGCTARLNGELLIDDQAGGGACSNFCTQDTHCEPNGYCVLSSSVCTTKLTTGEDCDRKEQCISGSCILAVCF